VVILHGTYCQGSKQCKGNTSKLHGML
jgi:hypothetical protein